MSAMSLHFSKEWEIKEAHRSQTLGIETCLWPLLFHISSNPKVKYPCEECGKKFLHKYYQKKHVGIIHLKLPRPVLFCDDCGKKFTNQSYLKRHKTIHLGISYPCEKCEFKTNSKDNLKNHMTLSSSSSSWRREWFMCSIVNTKAPRRVSEFIKNLNTEPILSNVMIVTTSPVGLNT